MTVKETLYREKIGRKQPYVTPALFVVRVGVGCRGFRVCDRKSSSQLKTEA